jgi:putative ABC transport system ATP-binding protein
MLVDMTQQPFPPHPSAHTPNRQPAPHPTPHASRQAVRIAARGLTRTYGSTHALAGVDLDVATGESLAVMGASGSGKSTLLLTLAGIERPDAGTVLYSSASGPVDVAALKDTDRSRLRRTDFGFVFQQGLLIPELTALENVALPLMVAGHPRADAESQAAQWLASLGLAGMESRRLNELSGGQAQRVAIARAQVAGARVVFADEPTGALDSRTSDEVMDVLLGSTVGRGASLVVVTHDADVAARCDRTVVLHDGRVIQEYRRGSGRA